MDCPEGKYARVFGKGRVLFCSLLLLLDVACTSKESLPYYTTADFTPMWDIDTLTSPVHRIGDFSFTNQNNQQITNADFAGKIYVANFFFTSCPSICPRMTDNLKQVADQFQTTDEVLFLSHSVMPWVDSVEQLKQFAERHVIRSSQWHLVTGPQEVINTLARQSYFVEEEIGLTKDSSEFLHTEHCLLIDRDRRIRGIYNGTLPLEMERLAADIRTLLIEVRPL